MDVIPVSPLEALLPGLRASTSLLLLLDYDGTLVLHADRPELAYPDPTLLDLLRRLCARAGTEVHIVSGRTAAFLETWLAGLPLYLHAEHGALSKGPGESRWARRKLPAPDWHEAVRPVLAEWVERTPGTAIELKETGLAWHWRAARNDDGEREADALAGRLEAVLRAHPVEILRGDMVLELRPRGVHKGLISGPHAVRTPGRMVLAAGNDLSDEELFQALAGSAITIVVGARPSMARYRVPDVATLRQFLGRILEE